MLPKLKIYEKKQKEKKNSNTGKNETKQVWQA